MLTKSLTKKFFLTAAECNSQMEMPLPMFVQTLVEVATDHANELGVGYSRLVLDDNSWVLMRLTMNMKRMPREGEHFTILTWVESFNRRFSERDFEVTVDGDEPEVLGQVKTIWAVINSSTRQATSLEGLEALEAVISHRETDLGTGPRIKATDFETSPDISRSDYRVVVSDIDSNRHLTSMRYFEIMLNMWPLSFYDHNIITRFEIAFSKEARYDELLTVERLDIPGKPEAACRLCRGPETLSLATLAYRPR